MMVDLRVEHLVDSLADLKVDEMVELMVDSKAYMTDKS
jgi:hypothetical protein